MDVTSAINSLGTDYVSKVSQAMQDSATGSTAKTDSTFDSIYNAVSGLLDSTNTYIQQAQLIWHYSIRWQFVTRRLKRIKKL